MGFSPIDEWLQAAACRSEKRLKRRNPAPPNPAPRIHSILSFELQIFSLSYSVTEEDMRALFIEFGDVSSAKLIMDRDTGRSKGFGFVEMSSNDAGQKAINELNGRDVGGRAMTVNEARPREDRPRGGGGGGGRGRDRY